MGSVSNFKAGWAFVGFLLISACANDEDKEDTAIAVEAKVFDVTIQSQSPDTYSYNDQTAWVGQAEDGSETRMLLAIPDILALFRDEVILSSIAHVEIQLVASDGNVNPDNIQLGFISQNWTPYATWNSRFSLAPDQNWQTPGGDLMNMPSVTPDVEKVSEGLSHKKLLFNVTDSILSAIDSGEKIHGFLLRVLPSDVNATNSSKIFTSNHSSAYAPKAILTFNNEDILLP